MGIYSSIELDEINQILDYYGLGEAKSFTATIEGTSNSNYRVDLKSGDRILLKISNDKTLEQLTNEQEVLQVLEKYEYDFSIHPLKTISGKSIYQHNGHFGVLFPFVNGLPPKVDGDVCKQVGTALAKLHSLEIRREDLQTIRPHDLVGHGGNSIYDYTQKENAATDFVRVFKEIFPKELQDIPYDVFPVGIIHGDLYFDNSLFNNGELVTLIDFEQSGRGRFILDLGIAISGTCLNLNSDNIDLVLMQAFIEGYEQKRKLLTIERDYIKTAILVGFFSIGLWRIERFFEGHLDSAKKFNYRELLTRAKKFNQMEIL